MKFNMGCEAFAQRLAIAYDRCAHDGSCCSTVADKAQWVIDKMDSIVAELKIPESFKAKYTIPQEDLEGLVAAGMQVTRLLVNNMREITADDARELYRQIM
jgi:alcohol dehydrogenase class IV